MNIKSIMQAKYPLADLNRYFAYLAQAKGAVPTEEHHIAPRAVFRKLAAVPENLVHLSVQEHFAAHVLLAQAVPECKSFQHAVWLMANMRAEDIRTDEIPFFAEVYERARLVQIERMKKLHAQPEFAAARDERMKKLHAQPEFAAARDERMKKLHADPEFAAAHIERMKKLNADPEFAAAHIERSRKHMKKLNADPEFAAARDERMKKLNADPEFAAARDERGSEVFKKLNADPEFAAANAERMKKLHADPEFAAAHIERMKKTNHTRWHVKRGIISPTCELCRLAAITSCTDELARCRADSNIGAAIGELDWLTELHRLLYEATL